MKVILKDYTKVKLKVIGKNVNCMLLNVQEINARRFRDKQKIEINLQLEGSSLHSFKIAKEYKTKYIMCDISAKPDYAPFYYIVDKKKATFIKEIK